MEEGSGWKGVQAGRSRVPDGNRAEVKYSTTKSEPTVLTSHKVPPPLSIDRQKAVRWLHGRLRLPGRRNPIAMLSVDEYFMKKVHSVIFSAFAEYSD